MARTPLCLTLALLCLALWPRPGAAADQPPLDALPFPQASKAAVERINARYYSLVRNQVGVLECTVTDSERARTVRALREAGQRAAADDLERMRMQAVASLTSGALTVTLANRQGHPAVTARLLADYVETSRTILQGFWEVARPYLTWLLDPGTTQVQSVVAAGGLVTVRVVDPTHQARKYVFDRDLRLQLLEVVDAQGALAARQIPTFQEAEGAYLVTTIRLTTPAFAGQFALTYQTVEGLTVPQGFVLTTTTTDAFAPVRVNFAEVLLRTRRR